VRPDEPNTSAIDDRAIADVSSARSMSISVVIPVYRDTGALSRILDVTDFGDAQVIVAATPDDDAALAPLRAARPDITWIDAPRGRASQMNAGAAVAGGDWIVFLHADTRLPDRWRAAIAEAQRDPRQVFGCFRFALDSPRSMARLIEFGVRLRVACFGLPYGDQAIFVRRDVFDAIGGYAPLPIMEDVDLVRRLAVTGRLFAASYPAVTSARKWERDGWVRVTARHLRLIVQYFAGVAPERLK
jgi:rSAM/selenodomain-associated transferase 2